MELLIHQLSEVIVTANQIKNWTEKDPILSRVHRFVLHGWPNIVDNEDLKPYFNCRDDLSIVKGYVLWGSRVIIPPPGQPLVLNQLHDTHPGVSRMESLSHSYVWWPGIDSDIVKRVIGCNICQLNRPSPSKASLHPWEYPSRPWAWIHIDHAGPFISKMFLIVIDAHTKWIDVEIVNHYFCCEHHY